MRLFVAINPAAGVRQEIWRVAGALRETGYPIRWVDPAAIHVTLKFLGAVDASREPELVAGLEAVCANVRAFDLAIRGFGAFPNPNRPRVVWVGCKPVPALRMLHRGIEIEMGRRGFPRDERAFHPHLTIGRVRRGGGRCPGLGDRLSSLTVNETVTVQTVDLMESTLARAGARYTRRHAAPLDAT